MMEKVGDLAVAFVSPDHLKQILDDEFIKWLVMTHVGKQFRDGISPR